MSQDARGIDDGFIGESIGDEIIGDKSIGDEIKEAHKLHERFAS